MIEESTDKSEIVSVCSINNISIEAKNAVARCNTLEVVLEKVGEYGKFQMFVHFTAMLACSLDIVQNVSVFFTGLPPSWICATNSTICTSKMWNTFDAVSPCNMSRTDWRYREDERFSFVVQYDLSCEREWLRQMPASIFFVGTMMGSIIFGWTSDNYGRKKTLVSVYISLILLGCFTSLSDSIWTLLILRFLIGLTAAVIQPNFAAILSEIVSTKHRSKVVVTVYAFWPIALSLLSLVAYLVPDWKTMVVIVTAPYALLLPALLMIPESILWLVTNNKIQRAQDVLKKICHCNKITIDKDQVFLKASSEDKKPNTTPLDIFRTKSLTITSLAMAFSFFTITMSYFGTQVGSGQLSSGSVHLNFVYSVLVELPAYVTVYILLERLGRKSTNVLCAAIGGLCCFGIVGVPQTTEFDVVRLSIGILGRFFVTIIYIGVIPWIIELYPTRIRSQGMGFSFAVGRLGGVISPWVMHAMSEVHPNASWMIVATLLMLTSMVMCALPETKGKPLQNVL